MKQNVKTELLRVLKNVMYMAALACAVGFFYHWIRGIICSCVADDIITAQDRVAAAYQFIYMALSGIVFCAFLFPTLAIKVSPIPDKLLPFYQKHFPVFFKKKEKETESK